MHPTCRRLQIISSGHASNDCPGYRGAEQNGGHIAFMIAALTAVMAIS
jgi:hypothetical protein